MPRVRNKRSGRVFDVPASHFSLDSQDYERVPEPEPKAEPEKPRRKKADKE